MNKIRLFLILSAFAGWSAGVNAQEIIASGYCGDTNENTSNGTNLMWQLTSDSVLTISGNGEMFKSYKFRVPPSWENYKRDVKKVVIEDGVTSIGHSAFYNFENLISISISKSVVIIGNKPFTNDFLLLSIDVDTDNIRYSSKEGVLYSKLQDTLLCYPIGKADTVIIPNTVTTIGNSAFSQCSGLTSVTIPESVVTIMDDAFFGCLNLPSVTIPNSVTGIGANCFGSCESLTSITIPESITTITNSAFSLCRSLETVIIPSSVTKIGGFTFAYCTGLETIICNATVPPVIYSNTFEGVSMGMPIYIPCGTFLAYYNSDWKYFPNKIDSCFDFDIEEAVLMEKVRISPNPAKDKLTIENGQMPIENVEIFDVAGRSVETHCNASLQGEITINISDLANGMYFLKIGNRTARFVKE